MHTTQLHTKIVLMPLNSHYFHVTYKIVFSGGGKYKKLGGLSVAILLVLVREVHSEKACSLSRGVWGHANSPPGNF